MCINIDSEGDKLLAFFKICIQMFYHRILRFLSHDIFFAVKNRRLLRVGTKIADPTRHALNYPFPLFASRGERK